MAEPRATQTEVTRRERTTRLVGTSTEVIGPRLSSRLERTRRSFVAGDDLLPVPVHGLVVLAAYAEDFMSERVYQGLTVGYRLALTQFVSEVLDHAPAARRPGL
jgi:hypothetical protein